MSSSRPAWSSSRASRATQCDPVTKKWGRERQRDRDTQREKERERVRERGESSASDHAYHPSQGALQRLLIDFSCN